MLKAWPNQKTPSSIMNASGSTSAVSATSEASALRILARNDSGKDMNTDMSKDKIDIPSILVGSSSGGCHPAQALFARRHDLPPMLPRGIRHKARRCPPAQLRRELATTRDYPTKPRVPACEMSSTTPTGSRCCAQFATLAAYKSPARRPSLPLRRPRQTVDTLGAWGPRKLPDR